MILAIVSLLLYSQVKSEGGSNPETPKGEPAMYALRIVFFSLSLSLSLYLSSRVCVCMRRLISNCFIITKLSRDDDGMKRMKKKKSVDRGIGIVLSVVAGLFYGTNFDPPTHLMDEANNSKHSSHSKVF